MSDIAPISKQVLEQKRVVEGNLSPQQYDLYKKKMDSLKSGNRGYENTGVYTYETEKAVEVFKDVPYRPPIKSKNDLSPASPYIEPNSSIDSEEERDKIEFCKRNPTDPRCGRSNVVSDENNPYMELGIFSQDVKGIFTPEGRADTIDANLVEKPLQTLYQSLKDDTQLTKAPVVRTECQCKDGSVRMGYLDTRSGSKDCSACDQKVIKKSTPNAYKNYKTKKVKAWTEKPVNVRNEMIGVSTLGDVDMKGCQTGAKDRATIKRIEATKSLNSVVSTKESRGSRVNPNTSVAINPSKSAFSIYDDCNMNIYGI